MRLAIFFNEKRLTGKLTKIFTGEYAYHTAWVNNQYYFDMNWQRRIGYWPKIQRDTTYKFYDFPEVTYEYLFDKLCTDHRPYGVADYANFALAPIRRSLGLQAKNKGGVICSEMINEDLIANGVVTTFDTLKGPPSPADLYHWCETTGR